MLYPNLVEVITHHPYHYSSFAEFADMTPELLVAILNGEDKFTSSELRGIAKCTNIPLGVIQCPHLIMLDRVNRKHQQMIEAMMDDLLKIWNYQKQGYKDAELFMRYWRQDIVNLELAFRENRASYGWYLGAKERVEQTLLFVSVVQRRESRRKKTA